MKLRFSHIDLEIELVDDKLTFITIEDSDQYYRCLLEIYNAANNEDSSFEIVDDDRIMDYSTIAELIVDPIGFSFEGSSFKKALIKTIMSSIDQDDIDKRVEKINQAVFDLLDYFNMELPFEIEYEEDFGLKELLSSYKVHIKPVEGRFTERLIDYITTVHRLTSKSVFILANCSDLITEDYYNELKMFCLYEKVQLVFMNLHQNTIGIMENEIILDGDLCEL